MATIIFPVLALFLTTTVVAALGESHNETCRRQYLVTATSTDTGTQLYLSTSEPSNFTLEIPDHFLPTQCGENYKLCDVLLIEMESTVIVFVPSQGGFVIVTCRVGETPRDIFYLVKRNCHPVKAFLNSEHNLVVIMCVELSSETNGSLFVVEFSLKWQTLRYSERFVLHSSRTLSEAVHASNRIFFTENDDLLVADSEASSSLNPGFITSINNCTQTKQIDVTENEVSIYCTLNNDSWTVLAKSRIFTHHTYSRYPCPGLNQYARVENKRLIIIGNTTQQSFVGELPDDIAYAACLGSGDSLVFWAFTETGQLFSVPLTTENHTITNLSACTTEGINCLRPSFDASKTCGAYFNHETNQVHITNITSLCGHRTVNMSFPPQLLRLTLGEKEDNCSCGANESPTSLPTSDVSLTSPIVVPVVVSILLVVIIIICCVVTVVIYKLSRKDSQRLEDTALVNIAPEVTALEGTAPEGTGPATLNEECSDSTSDLIRNPSSVDHKPNPKGQSAGPIVGASNSVCENPYGEGKEVKAFERNEDNDTRHDVVGGICNPNLHHPSAVAEINNARREGEENRNRSLNIIGHFNDDN